VEVGFLSELGLFLRQAREAKDISLDKIQEVTKIRKRYLQAIEVGEYSILPGQFYARAFVKSYAEAIGLNAESVLEQYGSELPELQQAPIETLTRRKNKEVKATSPKVGKWISRMVLYSFIVLVVFFIWWAAKEYVTIPEENQTLEPNKTNSGVTGEGVSNPEDQNQKGEDTEPEPKAEEPEKTEEIKEPIETAELKRLETVGTTTTFELVNASKMDVKLEAALGNVWYNLTDQKDKSTIDTEELRKGTEKHWDLSEYTEVRLRLGNPLNSKVIVSGQLIDLSELPKPQSPHNLIFRFIPKTNE
jgi:cytoskeletal protein RodZ